MSNYAWVCFECRFAVRRHGKSKDVRCPRCSQQCFCLGYKTPIPPKANIKKWRTIKESYFHVRREYILRRNKEVLHKKHDLEKEIVHFEAMPKNSDTQATIEWFQTQLGELHV